LKKRASQTPAGKLVRLIQEPRGRGRGHGKLRHPRESGQKKKEIKKKNHVQGGGENKNRCKRGKARGRKRKTVDKQS